MPIQRLRTRARYTPRLLGKPPFGLLRLLGVLVRPPTRCRYCSDRSRSSGPRRTPHLRCTRASPPEPQAPAVSNPVRVPVRVRVQVEGPRNPPNHLAWIRLRSAPSSTSFHIRKEARRSARCACREGTTREGVIYSRGVSGPAWSGRMSFKARLMLMLILGVVSAAIVYAVVGRRGDDDEPQVSHVATAADYGGGSTTTEDEPCESYLVTPLAGHTDVHRRVQPRPNAPSLGTLPSGTVVAERESRDGYVRLAQPLIGWVSRRELQPHCP